MLTWVDPWPVLVPAVATILTIVLAIELVLALVRSAVEVDSAGGDT